MVQLREIEPKLTELGFQVIAVSADRPERVGETIKRHELNYLLLSDNTMEGAKALGLAYKVDEQTYKKLLQDNVNLEEASGERHHLLPVPAVFFIGTDNLIKFEYVNPNHRIRLDPEILLVVAKILKGFPESGPSS